MGNSDRRRTLAEALQAFHSSAQKAGPAAMASYSLIGAIIMFGGLGYAIDRWRGTEPWFLVGGLVLGLVYGFYQLARTVWRR
ncbi:MAG TPA: AtpZ/AtpI family protein [Vicinamibacterales bacterium]|nr:AtpZ/AtpI family protein [Vicinamibacterales bacterium]